MFLVPLVERALVENYFHCSKCGFTEHRRDPDPEPEKPDTKE